MEPLPPETRLGYWVPAVHYLLAAALVAATVLHVDLRLTPLLQAICVLAAAGLTVVGTLIWALHHYGMNQKALATFAAYLKSVVPDLLTDVNSLKAAHQPAASNTANTAPVTMIVHQSSPSPTAMDAAARAAYLANHPPTVAEAKAEVAKATEDLNKAMGD